MIFTTSNSKYMKNARCHEYCQKCFFANNPKIINKGDNKIFAPVSGLVILISQTIVCQASTFWEIVYSKLKTPQLN